MQKKTSQIRGLTVGDLVYHLLYGREWVGILLEVVEETQGLATPREVGLIQMQPGSAYEFFFEKNVSTRYKVSDTMESSNKVSATIKLSAPRRHHDMARWREAESPSRSRVHQIIYRIPVQASGCAINNQFPLNRRNHGEILFQKRETPSNFNCRKRTEHASRDTARPLQLVVSHCYIIVAVSQVSRQHKGRGAQPSNGYRRRGQNQSLRCHCALEPINI